MYDPEGALATVPTVASVWIGTHFGRALRADGIAGRAGGRQRPERQPAVQQPGIRWTALFRGTAERGEQQRRILCRHRAGGHGLWRRHDGDFRCITEPKSQDQGRDVMFRTDLMKGKRILVTGGGTGLGKSMATRFLELGAEVFICGRRLSVLEETAKEMADATGGKVTPLACDIRVADAVEEVVAEVWRGGPLDALVNNAAGNFISPTEDLSPRAFDAISNIVLHGTFYMTNACGKRWLADGHSASVLSILTTWVWTGSPYVVPSAMSKAGVAAMTKSLAVEWGPRGIRCNAIAPGPFPTEGAWARLSPTPELAERQMSSIPMRRYGEHSELANMAAFLLADEVAYINGEVIAIDGGQWLYGAGTFARLGELSDEQWSEIRELIRGTTARDKAQRSV